MRFFKLYRFVISYRILYLFFFLPQVILCFHESEPNKDVAYPFEDALSKNFQVRFQI